MVKGFIAAAFTPKPTAVTADKVAKETWPPSLPAIGTLHAYQGIDIAPQIGIRETRRITWMEFWLSLA